MSRYMYLLKDKCNGEVTDIIISSKTRDEVQEIVDDAIKNGENDCEWENIMEAFEKDDEIEVALNVDLNGSESIWY